MNRHDSHSQKLDELDSLLLDALDGALSNTARERLNTLLRDDASLREHAAARLQEEVLLREELRTAEVAHLFDDEMPLPLHIELPEPEAYGSNHRWRWFAALAGCVLLAAAVRLVLVQAKTTPRALPDGLIAVDDQDNRFTVAQPDRLAVITRTINVDWQPNSLRPDMSGTLGPGHLQIASGLLQVEFFSGARLILEGPADFQLVSPMQAVCHYGKLRAMVPPQAHGFRVASAAIDVVDLGTEFGMQIDQDGQGEVHVLDGQVALRDPTGQADEQLLDDGAAVRFTSNGQFHEITSNRHAFIGDAYLSQLEANHQAQRYQIWHAESQKLRADPAALFYANFEDSDPTNRLVHNDAANRLTSDGAIVGCHWAQGRWPGKGAIEFKRISDRVRVNLPGRHRAITFVAWVRIEGFDRWLSSLVLTDEWRQGGLHWQLSDAGEIILGVHGHGNHFSPQVLSPADLGRWIHLATVIDPGTVTHYLDGRPVYTKRIRHARPFELNAAELGNWTPGPSITDNRIRSLNGRLDELGIFSRAFTDEEVAAMFAAGAPG